MVVVRGAGDADRTAALAVWRAASTARRGWVPLPEREAQMRRNVSKPDACLVVATEGVVAVGMALAMPSRANDGAGPPVPGVCYIDMVAVLPDRWGQGIGGQLVDALLSEARARGYDRAQLWTHATNRRAQRLYESRGFQRTGRERGAADGEQSVQYVCAL
ncbi:MAG: GNAT family N-acetyltransferase [Chloroflexota bacterium]|nr:GNAT family N-acetyltransferase [Chloroflexota bacterium]